MAQGKTQTKLASKTKEFVACAACIILLGHGPILAPCREKSDCYATKLKRTQCSCRTVFNKSMGEEGARVRREKEDELDIQVRAHQARLRSELQNTQLTQTSFLPDVLRPHAPHDVSNGEPSRCPRKYL